MGTGRGQKGAAQHRSPRRETPVEWGSPPARRPLSRGPALPSVPRGFSDRRTRPLSRPWPGSRRRSSHSVRAQAVRVAERVTLPPPSLTPCPCSQHRTQPPKPRPAGRVRTPPLSVTNVRQGRSLRVTEQLVGAGRTNSPVGTEVEKPECESCVQGAPSGWLRVSVADSRRHRGAELCLPVCRSRPVPRRCPLPAAHWHRAHGAGGGGPGLQRGRH